MRDRAGGIAERLERVRERVAEAALKAGRAPGEVRIVAVSKYAAADQIRAAANAGQKVFGENYVLDGLRKISALDDPALRWHMIGQLQSNKAAKAAESFDVIESLCTSRAARAVSRAMEKAGEARSCFLQIRLGGAEGRGGVDPERALELAAEIAALPGIALEGVMGVAPPDEPARPHFARLRDICENLRSLDLRSATFAEISAGMSADFEEAIAEGSTSVRIGSAIFGESGTR